MMVRAGICYSLLSMMALAAFSTSVPADAGQVQAIDGNFSKWSKETSPGCAVGVYLNDELAFARGYDMAGLELRVPITPETVFDFSYSEKTGPQAPLSCISFVGGKESTFNALKLDIPTSQQLKAFTGNFRCDELGVIYRLDVVGGALQRMNARGEVERFRALERGEFNYGNLTMKFRRAARSGYDTIILDIGRVRGLVCFRM